MSKGESGAVYRRLVGTVGVPKGTGISK
jgi:hypothetical protein